MISDDFGGGNRVKKWKKRLRVIYERLLIYHNSCARFDRRCCPIINFLNYIHNKDRENAIFLSRASVSSKFKGMYPVPRFLIRALSEDGNLNYDQVKNRVLALNNF